MNTTNTENKWSLFGLDLRLLPTTFKTGWQELTAYPPLSWLEPPTKVWLVDQHGQYAHYQNGQIKQKPVKHPLSARANLAAVVPEERILERALILPRLSGKELAETLKLELAAQSPFGMENTAWGWTAQIRDSRTQSITLVLADAEYMAQYQQSIQAQHPRHNPELWHLTEDNQAVVLQGFGEDQRLSRQNKHRWLNYSLVMLLGLIIFASMLLPALSQYLQARDAHQQMQQIQQQAGPALAAREQWQQGLEQAEQIRQQTADLPDPLDQLELLSRLIPDDTYLANLELTPLGVRLSGQSERATNLISTLESHARIENVTTPTAITRDARSGLDNFSLHFDIIQDNQ